MGGGNFASALCLSFTPYEPYDHSGNCGVNSFLMALNGVLAYSGPNDPKLRTDIQEFRENLKTYALAHKEELERFGDIEYQTFIAKYETEWMSPLLWECAARHYQRKIIVYTQEGPQFRTDEFGQVAPASVHNAKALGNPVRIICYGGVHYGLLMPK